MTSANEDYGSSKGDTKLIKKLSTVRNQSDLYHEQARLNEEREKAEKQGTYFKEISKDVLEDMVKVSFKADEYMIRDIVEYPHTNPAVGVYMDLKGRVNPNNTDIDIALLAICSSYLGLKYGQTLNLEKDKIERLQRDVTAAAFALDKKLNKANKWRVVNGTADYLENVKNEIARLKNGFPGPQSLDKDPTNKKGIVSRVLEIYYNSVANSIDTKTINPEELIRYNVLGFANDFLRMTKFPNLGIPSDQKQKIQGKIFELLRATYDKRILATAFNHFWSEEYLRKIKDYLMLPNSPK